MLYPEYKDKYPDISKLPLLDLPLAIRKGDPNLRFNPHFQFTQKNFIINVGPTVFSVVCQHPYVGWDEYFMEIQDAFRKAVKIGLISKAVRLGVRYINFFDGMDIFAKLKVGIEFDGNSLIGNKNNIRTEIIEGNYLNVVHITNNATIVHQGKSLNGSIVDIDIVNNGGPTLMADLPKLINEAHNKEKRIFFGLLKKDYLETLGPKY